MGIWQGRDVYQLLVPLRFSVWGFLYGEAPQSMWTDHSSVPRQSLMPIIYAKWGGRCTKESVPHDYGYRRGASLWVIWDRYDTRVQTNEQEIPEDVLTWLMEHYGQEIITDIPRFVWDVIFRQLMIEEGEPLDLYDPMYLAVKLGGGSSYHVFEVMDPLPCDRINMYALD